MPLALNVGKKPALPKVALLSEMRCEFYSILRE
jgi:hypothetical protein